MCQFSESELDDEASPITQAKALRAKQHFKRRAAGKPSTAVQHDVYARPSQSENSSVREHCVRGWWRDALCTTSNELNAQLPSFSSHLETLRSAQKRMHLLACRCTQARLYPNPASTNSKFVLKAQLSALEADMDFSIRLHDTYSAALHFYTCAVQAVTDNLNISGREYHCTKCTPQIESWRFDTHIEIRLEAEGLAHRLHELNKTFKKLHKDLLKKWEKMGRDGLRRMIDALPEQDDLKSKAVVRKYFPRQIREFEKAESKTIRKPTIVGRSDSKVQAKIDGDTYDNTRETTP
ncbi:hypothetical protein E8E11_005606 [Didymella keratinophila]|nr:hypothetical protein E8E11_005606 [Didymella keratinophila]